MPTAPTPGLPQRFDLSAYLFNAAGRSGRTAALVGIVLVAILVQPLQWLHEGWAHGVYGWTVGFLAFVIWATVTARRLHDLGRAGWWVAPLFGLVWLAAFTAPRLQWLGGALSLLIVALHALLLIWPGEPGFNRFGPPPR